MVVKVLRPGVEQRIRADLDVLLPHRRDWRRTYWRDGRRLRPREVVAEYEKTVLDELDLVREAANAAQLKRNFEGSTLLYVPEVYWDLTRREVMVMERIRGVPVERYRHPARTRHRHAGAGGEWRGDLLHPGVQAQLLPRRHASRATSSWAWMIRRSRSTWRWTSASSAP